MASTRTPPTPSLQNKSLSTSSRIALRVPDNAPKQGAVSLVRGVEVYEALEVLAQQPAGTRRSIECLYCSYRLGVVPSLSRPKPNDCSCVDGVISFDFRSLRSELLWVCCSDIGHSRCTDQQSCRVLVGSPLSGGVVGYLLFLVNYGVFRITVASSDVADLVRHEEGNTPRLVVSVAKYNDGMAFGHARETLEVGYRELIDWNDRDPALPTVRQDVT